MLPYEDEIRSVEGPDASRSGAEGTADILLVGSSALSLLSSNPHGLHETVPSFAGLLVRFTRPEPSAFMT